MSEAETRDFPLAAVLAVTTGVFVGGAFGDVQAVMTHLVREPLFTHQLPRAWPECRAALLAQHPALADADVEVRRLTGAASPDGVSLALAGWLAGMERRHGATLPVAPMPAREPQYDTPVADLIEMRGGDTRDILVVDAERAP